MTTPYDDPIEDGDAVLLLDGEVCLEVEGLADHWDDVLRRNTAQVLRARASQVAVARPRGELRPGDYRIWRELRGSNVQLLPVRALPAA